MKAFTSILVAGLSLTIGHAAAVASDVSAQTESNKAAVTRFYEKALNEGDADGALAEVGGRYVQHNPFAEDGKNGFRKFVDWRHAKFPHAHSDILKVFSDGDFVILHVHSVREPGTRGNAIIDIFKLENGRIVEHWDVVQPISEKIVHTNTMF
jgi:predicted SnoaL-like aldol condensation-catalyzing enzyme